MDAAMNLKSGFHVPPQFQFQIVFSRLTLFMTQIQVLKSSGTARSWSGNYVNETMSVPDIVEVAKPCCLTMTSSRLQGLASISEETRSLALKARDNKLQPHDFEGGTVSVTNVGMIGVTSFPGMVNPPQACTVGVCCTKDILVPDEVSSLGHRRAKMMSVTLSCDHRVVDEEVAVHWLHHFKCLLERPDLMLL
ncbi:unnamed protein product [Ixodes persulcatus]